MIRLVIASVCLFILEVYLFCVFSPTILQKMTGIDIKYLTFTAKQRRVVYNIQRQDALNLHTEPAIYVLGGSTCREFFFIDEQMSRMAGRPFVNLGASNQTLIDSLRLVDNIKGDNATVLYCLYPMKFMRFSPTVPVDSRYLMGAYLKYPVPSFAVERLLADVTPRNITTALVAELNVYCYLLKNYFLQKNFKLQQKLSRGAGIPLKKLFLDHRPPIQHFYHHQAYHRSRLRLELLNIKKKIGPHLNANLEVNFDHLGRLIDLARQRGQQIRLMELPYSLTFERMFQRELRIYRQHLDAFLQKHSQARFIRIDFDTYRGREELFYDHGHLLDMGRVYFYPFVETLFKKDFSLAALH